MRLSAALQSKRHGLLPRRLQGAACRVGASRLQSCGSIRPQVSGIGYARSVVAAVRAVSTAAAGRVTAKRRPAKIRDAYTKGGDVRNSGTMLRGIDRCDAKSPAASARAWNDGKPRANAPGSRRSMRWWRRLARR
ncbi:hypothetical protein [Ralstonia syzygii]|uniref:Uncharacterized protein n=1 Tax=Ralstonia syzygii R24 TaxID=907261 RepID=G3AC68_9RALS|nr:hypothetical protein [Ralstonia syzygii]CCA87142.1 conserved hypothetical protein [Ralstonia syzygii R24]